VEKVNFWRGAFRVAPNGPRSGYFDHRRLSWRAVSERWPHMDEEFGDDNDFIAAAAAVEHSHGPPKPAGGARSNSAANVVQPKPQALPSRQAPSAILVSTRQKGNPILNHVRSLPWEYSDIQCDYVLGATTCALFLSLKYHRLHPEYIYSRLRAVGKSYNLRVLLTMVDITNHEEALKELSKTSMINNLTLILCWSAQEAGRYLELFKSYEHASPASIRAHQAESYKESLSEFVTTPRSINKTDAASLISNFGTLRAAVNAQPEELALVPGWGEKKVKVWCSTMRENFRVRKAAKAGINMAQIETAANLAADDGPGGKTPRPNIHTPIPIGMIPSSEASGLGVSRDNTLLGSSHKRRYLEEVGTGESNSDEEAVLLAEAEQTGENMSIANDLTSAARKRPEPDLSEGVTAALAKLRENG
jgi:DNA excision repair protein ERCC-1